MVNTSTNSILVVSLSHLSISMSIRHSTIHCLVKLINETSSLLRLDWPAKWQTGRSTETENQTCLSICLVGLESCRKKPSSIDMIIYLDVSGRVT